jgi:hypothetical protein
MDRLDCDTWKAYTRGKSDGVDAFLSEQLLEFMRSQVADLVPM